MDLFYASTMSIFAINAIENCRRDGKFAISYAMDDRDTLYLCINYYCQQDLVAESLKGDVVKTVISKIIFTKVRSQRFAPPPINRYKSYIA